MNNPRQFWKNIKEVIPKNGSKITSSVPFIKDYSASDNDESQQKSKADIFCTFFSSVANNVKHKAIKLCNFTWRKVKSNPMRITSTFKSRLGNKVWVANQLRLFIKRAVHSQLLDHLEKYNLLLNCHYGYRKNRSTKLASTLLLDDVQKSVDRGELVGAVFINLSKAFDTNGHEILLSKLLSYGIRNTELKWFTDYLFSRK